jgi:hypothetical protein
MRRQKICLWEGEREKDLIARHLMRTVTQLPLVPSYLRENSDLSYNVIHQMAQFRACVSSAQNYYSLRTIQCMHIDR